MTADRSRTARARVTIGVLGISASFWLLAIGALLG